MRIRAGTGIVAAFAWVWTGAAIGEEATADPCVEDRPALMAMDYWTFDTSAEGMRSVAEKPGCELAAADLVEDFHAQLRATGGPVTMDHEGQTIILSENGEIETLYWHEGQLRALAGQTEAAAALFRKSVKPEDESNLGWNDYVRATLAFVEGDRETLLSEREALASEVRPGHEVNLRVVDGLIACFGRSYEAAYGSDECNHRSVGIATDD